MWSGLDLGQNIEIKVDEVKAIAAPNKRMLAGLTFQNHSPPALAEKRVKKSETETFK